MIVFILIDNDYEAEFKGVFSTREKAEQSAKGYSWSHWGYEIREVEIDCVY